MKNSGARLQDQLYKQPLTVQVQKRFLRKVLYGPKLYQGMVPRNGYETLLLFVGNITYYDSCRRSSLLIINMTDDKNECRKA